MTQMSATVSMRKTKVKMKIAVIRIDDANVKGGCLISSQNTMGNCRNCLKLPQHQERVYLFEGHVMKCVPDN